MDLPPVHVDLEARQVVGPAGTVVLRDLEARLLAALAARAGEVCSREALLAEVWGYGPRIQTRALDTTLCRLRAKVELDPSSPRYLLTDPGRGIRLVLGAAPPLGRGATWEALRAACAEGPWVTLVGPGGSGKSMLARAWRDEVGGAWCALEGQPPRSGIALALGAAVSGAWSPQVASAEALAALLVRSEVHWLVVDGADGALEPLAELLPVLAARAPRLRVLCTSREPLGLANERTVAVGGLGPEAAAALFAARGGRVVSGLDAVLAAVDHLPLAVEILAAWSTILPLPALARAVAHELHALEVDRRDLPDRHRSFARVVQDSVARLTPTDAAALSALAVFQGEFSVDDARAVLGADALVTVGRLARRSLVRVSAPGPMALFGVVRGALHAGAPRAAWEALARHRSVRPSASAAADLAAAAIALAGEAGSDDALAAAQALARVPGIAPEEVAPLLARAAGGDPARLAAAALARAELLWRVGQRAGARAALGAVPADAAVADAARSLMALLDRDDGDNATALAALDDLVLRLADGPDRALYGQALADRGVVLARLGRPEEAESSLQAGVAVLRRVGAGGALAAALSNLAGYQRESAGQDPLPLLMEALSLHQQAGQVRSEGIVRGAIGLRYLDRGALGEASQAFDHAIDALERAGSPHIAAVFVANRAFVARLRGRLAEARQGYEAAVSVLERTEDRNYLALALGNLGEIDLLEGAVAVGRGRLEAAVALARRAGFAMIEGVFRGALALESATRTGDMSGFLEAERLLREGGFRDERGRLLARWAEAEARRGDLSTARERLAEAEALDRGVPWVAAAIAAARAAVGGDTEGGADAPPRVG